MTECPSVLPFGSLATEFHPQVGGKCASLGVMIQAGLPVPPGFAITTRAFAEAGEASGLMPRINELLAGTDITDAAALRAASAQAREMVTSWRLLDEHQALLDTSYAELCDLVGVPDVPVAVRSSATSEDSPEASFAGEHDTYLWVCGIDAVRQKVRECWASLFTERAIVYRAEMDYPHDEVDMAVAVQKMVRPRAAGVAFTLDPTNGDRSGICIDSAWGFGEGVVSGDVTPDNFLVDKVMWTINRRTISQKTHAHLLSEVAAGEIPTINRVELPADQVGAPSLTDDEIIAIARLARAAEKHYGRPQDIEWALDDDLPAGQDVVLLQARPETVWSRKSHAVHAKGDLMASIVDTLVNPLSARRGAVTG
jgi:pyruvate,water dikinase